MKPVYVTATFLLTIFTVLVISPLCGDGQSTDCCSKLSIPKECHFLCGVGSEGFWTVTRWKCTAKYSANIIACKFTNGLDYLKIFGNKLTNKLKDGFDKLSLDIRKRLQNAKEFAKASVAQLMQVPQDILCALKDATSGMTSQQFKGLAKHFTTFTAQNLRNLLSNVNPQAFFDSINELMGLDWDAEQLAALLKAAFRKYGTNVSEWSKEAFADLKQMIAGIESGELMDMGAENFKEVTKYVCSAKLNDDQTKALLVPAKAAYGDVSTWDEVVLGKLCGVLRALPVEEILQLTGKMIVKVDVISKSATLSYPQARALLEKVKEDIGTDISNWSSENIIKLGKFVKDLDVEDLKQMSRQFKHLLSITNTLGKIEWSPGRARQLAKKALESLGLPGNWTAANLKKLKHIAGGLLPSELQLIVNKVLKEGLEAFKGVALEIDQAQEIVNKLKAELKDQLQNLDQDDLVAVASALDGFLASDIGRMSQLVVYVAFPELKVAKEVALPIIRELLKMYKKDASGKNDIGRLRNIAVGLSRSELDDETLKTIVDNLDELGAIPWDKTQVLEIAKRVREEWGNINDTDISSSDLPKWGFINLKKLGRVALGIAKEELRDLPIRGIEDAIDVLGKQKEWNRGQVTMVLKRLREYWEMEELDFSNFTELDVSSLGSFVQGMTGKELNKLPERVLLIAIRRLGEETGIPQDKLKARAYTAVQYFKSQSGVDVLNSSHIRDMGNLVAGMSRGALRQISQDAFVQNLYSIARSKGFDQKKVSELAKLAKKHFGQSDVSKWMPKQWRDLSPAIAGLEPSDLRRISKEALGEVMDELNKIDFTKNQAQALVNAVKDVYGRNDVYQWTGEQLRQLSSIARGLSVDDILSIGKDAFEDAVGVWGKQLNIDLDNLKAMAVKAKEYMVNSDVSKFTAMQIKRLGRVVLGFELSDLAKLKIDSVDVIAALGTWKGWTEDQIKVLAPKIKEFLTKNVGKIDYVYMSLGQLSTVLNKLDISKIPSKSFNLAVKQLGAVDGWNDEQRKALMSKINKEWPMGVSLWDRPRVSELGYLQKSISTADIPKLDPKVVDAIKPEVLSEMSISQLKSFTPEQYRSMETPQVESISRAKKSMLTADQRSAIQSVSDNDPIEEDPWGPDCSGNTCSGSSHVTVGVLSMLGIVIATALINTF